MTTSSTQAAGKNAAHRITVSLSMAVLATALAACGGGGGASSTLPTGATVNAQVVSTSTFAAEPAVTVHAASAAPQQLLAVGALAAGGHAVAWLDAGNGAPASVRLQRFDSSGVAAGSVFLVGVDTLPGAPAAAAMPDGGLVVAAPVAAPASVDEPWVTRSAIRVQRLDGAGAMVGDVDVGVVLQNRIGATTMRYVEAPAVVRWDDGSFLVGWALVDDDGAHKSPQFWVQRFSAAGQPLGAAALAAQGDPDSSFALTATPNGGWLLTTRHRLQGRTVLRYHPFAGATAPTLPTGSPGVAEGSVLVPLAGGGSVLLQPVQNYGSLRLFAADGSAQGMASGLPLPAVAGAALRDGGFVAFLRGASGGLVAQRFDAAATALGGLTAVAAAESLQAAALADGGLVFGWNHTVAPGDTDVLAQRLR
jgi:hypothetical protein